MAQHFSQSKAYRNLDFWQFANLTEEEAREQFTLLRWGSTTTMPCPRCQVIDQHIVRRHRHQWRCRHCDMVFSVTTGTPFSNRKLPYKKLLLLIYMFVASPKGLAPNQFHPVIKVTLRTAYLNLSKIREAIFHQSDDSPLSGIVQVDGGHFCGKPRRPRVRRRADAAMINSKLRSRKQALVPPSRKGRMEPWNYEKLKNRRVVIVLRQLSDVPGDGATRSIAVIVRAEDVKSAYPVIRRYVTPGSILQSDEGNAYQWASMFYKHETVRHSEMYSTDEGVNNNQAESYFGRFRRAEFGVHHGMRPQYLAFYASEFCWREDVRQQTLDEKFRILMSLIFRSSVSRAWCGYAQGRRLGIEHLPHCFNREVQ